MLSITIPARKESSLWDERNEEFIYIPAREEKTIELEHSLLSISKWEQKWCKPFFSKKEMTKEETVDYIRCMTITKNVNIEDCYAVANDEKSIKKILNYMKAPMTATTFSNSRNRKKDNTIFTSEVFYYLMFANGIPKECEKWHINRLITLIRVFGEKNDPGKKMSKRDTARYYSELNAARKKKLNTRG